MISENNNEEINFIWRIFKRLISSLTDDEVRVLMSIVNNRESLCNSFNLSSIYNSEEYYSVGNIIKEIEKLDDENRVSCYLNNRNITNNHLRKICRYYNIEIKSKDKKAILIEKIIFR